MHHRRFDYMHFAKELERAPGLSLAFSGAPPRHPASLLGAAALRIEDPEDALRRSIGATYGVRPEQVVLCVGTSQANALVALSQVRAGDEAIVERPAYEALPGLLQWLGADVRRLDRTREQGYGLDLERLAALITPRTKLIALSHPHNPSGRPLTETELKALGELAAAHKVPVLVDEVYRDDLADPLPPVAARVSEWLLTTSSVTKVYGLGAIRVGWILTTAERAGKLRDLNHWMHVDPPGPSLAVALAAWPHLGALLRESAQSIAACRNVLEQWRSTTGALPGVIHDGMPFYLAELDQDDRTFAAEARARGVLLAPGSFFEAPRTTRIGFGRISPEQLERALRLLGG